MKISPNTRQAFVRAWRGNLVSPQSKYGPSEVINCALIVAFEKRENRRVVLSSKRFTPLLSMMAHAGVTIGYAYHPEAALKLLTRAIPQPRGLPPI